MKTPLLILAPALFVTLVGCVQSAPPTGPSSPADLAPDFSKMDWILTEVDGKAAPYRATLNLGTPGRMSGQAPCNRYSGTLTIDGTSFRPGPIAATRMACADLDGETAYFRSLEKVTTAERGPGRLTLSGDGHTLTFVQPID